MGFQSKFSGERYLVFDQGKLIDVEPTPDHVMPQSGFLDMLDLYQAGDEVGGAAAQATFTAQTIEIGVDGSDLAVTVGGTVKSR
ncbi:MAG: hypothetical protein CMO26_22620 [Thiotrichales bacterium]|nr:hypothetical protein [Thiotrichales bacterium]